ncbi:MAG: alanine dehydrogenase [Cyclobacteriaceae bacterium]|nr:alanine dehydrogenase [Cyclobacteriaceae bacterium]
MQLPKLSLGIVREEKKPQDSRSPFSPEQAASIVRDFSIDVFCETSSVRCFSDEEYKHKSVPVVENLEKCDIIFGVKEVPVNNLMEGKTYFMFSHTIKKQPYNKKLLQAILQKNIRLIDYECLTDANGTRVVAFGYWAGVVGAYNALWTCVRRYNTGIQCRRAYQCFDLDDLKNELKKIELPPLKFVLTGGGRVAGGARDLLQWAGIREVSPENYTGEVYQECVFANIDVDRYVMHREGLSFDFKHFEKHPHEYVSSFEPYARNSDVLISAAYWDPQAPRLFELEETMNDEFKIKVIADITCDINGSVPTTLRATTIQEPVFDFSPVFLEERRPFSDPANITVMSIDNLPSELPRDASESFGDQLIAHVLPALLGKIDQATLNKATIAEKGKLTEKYRYLEDYVS